MTTPPNPGEDYSGIPIRDRVSGWGAGLAGSVDAGLAVVFVCGVALFNVHGWQILATAGTLAGLIAVGLAIAARRSAWAPIVLAMIAIGLLVGIAVCIFIPFSLAMSG